MAFDMDKSINEGAIRLPEYQGDGWWTLKPIQDSKLFDTDKKLKDFTAAELNDLYHVKPMKVKINGVNLTFEGVVDKFVLKYINNDLTSMSERTQKIIRPFIVNAPCEVCHGGRLTPKALACKIDGYNIADLSSIQVDKLLAVVQEFDAKENHVLVKTCLLYTSDAADE